MISQGDVFHPLSLYLRLGSLNELGSVRVIIDGSGTVKERNDYYAFGAKHIHNDYPQNTNRYDYNGKEEQTTGDLGFLDYGARMYDAALGRWHSIDPKAEKYYSLTTYDFVGGNPISHIDPNGESWFFDPIGNFLGEVNPDEYEVRVLSFEDRKKYMSDYNALINNSNLLSRSNLSDIALMKVFDYFNKLVNLNTPKLRFGDHPDANDAFAYVLVDIHNQTNKIIGASEIIYLMLSLVSTKDSR